MNLHLDCSVFFLKQSLKFAGMTNVKTDNILKADK
jgi:hypothetical protein